MIAAAPGDKIAPHPVMNRARRDFLRTATAAAGAATFAPWMLDLGDLGLDEGAHLLIKRALARDRTVTVTRTAPTLAIDLPAWCRARGHALEQLAPVETKIRQRRKSLADEIGRAAESVALNVSEARQRAGLDRADLFRRAAGSASELTTALRIARARSYITPADFAAVDAPLDRVRAMLWRLTH